MPLAPGLCTHCTPILPSLLFANAHTLRIQPRWNLLWVSQVAPMVKNLPEMQVQFLGLGKIPWRRAWQPTPAFLPGESHGQRSLMGYTVHGVAESDTTEMLTLWELPLRSFLTPQTTPAGWVDCSAGLLWHPRPTYLHPFLPPCSLMIGLGLWSRTVCGTQNLRNE